MPFVKVSPLFITALLLIDTPLRGKELEICLCACLSVSLFVYFFLLLFIIFSLSSSVFCHHLTSGFLNLVIIDELQRIILGDQGPGDNAALIYKSRLPLFAQGRVEIMLNNSKEPLDSFKGSNILQTTFILYILPYKTNQYEAGIYPILLYLSVEYGNQKK